MIGRRLLALVGVLGVVLAALVLPAAAQTAPPRITGVTPNCAAQNVRTAVTVTVSGASAIGMGGWLDVISPSGQYVSQGSWADTNQDGQWSTTVSITPSEAGYFSIRAYDRTEQTSNTEVFSVPCRNTRLSLSPACSTPGTAQNLTVTGLEFLPNGTGYVYYDWDGSKAAQSRIRIPIDGAGTFATSPAYQSSPFAVTAPNRTVTIRATDQGRIVDIGWSPCPPPGSTTTAPTTTTSTTAPPDDEPPPTTTTRPPVPGSFPTTSTTLPVTVDIPPPTPGATLVLTPPLGPTGFVTGAVGTGFPPGPVELTWSGGIGTTMTIAGPDGTFSTRVLVLPGDRLGPRALVATGGGTSTYAAFLVVPSTVQPSGENVAQINRIRRFNNR